MSEKKISKWRVSSEFEQWEPFIVEVYDGKVISCFGKTRHPVGSDWASLSSYYKKLSGDQAAKIEEVTE